MVIITHTHTHTFTSVHTHYLDCTDEMQKTKRREGGVQGEAEKKMRRSKKKMEEVKQTRKKMEYGTKSGGYVNVESESSGRERRYNVLSWPGGRGAECPGAGWGRWPDLSGYHYVEGEVFSVTFLYPSPLSTSDSISLPGQRWGGLGSGRRWRVTWGELGSATVVSDAAWPAHLSLEVLLPKFFFFNTSFLFSRHCQSRMG